MPVRSSANAEFLRGQYGCLTARAGRRRQCAATAMPPAARPAPARGRARSARRAAFDMPHGLRGSGLWLRARPPWREPQIVRRHAASRSARESAGAPRVRARGSLAANPACREKYWRIQCAAMRHPDSLKKKRWTDSRRFNRPKHALEDLWARTTAGRAVWRNGKPERPDTRKLHPEFAYCGRVRVATRSGRWAAANAPLPRGVRMTRPKPAQTAPAPRTLALTRQGRKPNPAPGPFPRLS